MKARSRPRGTARPLDQLGPQPYRILKSIVGSFRLRSGSNFADNFGEATAIQAWGGGGHKLSAPLYLLYKYSGADIA
jgi:hypothetical protein